MFIMKIKVFTRAVLFILFAVTAGVSAGVENDPFYPGNRPAVKTPVRDTTATEATAETGTWGRDPFNNPFAGKTAAPAKEPVRAGRGKGLTGVIYSPDVRLAIINGETFREGAMVGERKLVNIRMHSVVFLNAAGGREEEFLEDFSVKK